MTESLEEQKLLFCKKKNKKVKKTLWNWLLGSLVSIKSQIYKNPCVQMMIQGLLTRLLLTQHVCFICATWCAPHRRLKPTAIKQQPCARRGELWCSTQRKHCASSDSGPKCTFSLVRNHQTSSGWRKRVKTTFHSSCNTLDSKSFKILKGEAVL